MTLVNSNEEFNISQYVGFKRVLDFGFLKKGFYVCWGDQPATLHLYNLNGVFLKRFARDNRNLLVFNNRETMMIECGFGNLPGFIHITKD